MIPDLYISHRAIPAAQAAADADTTYFQLICVSARFTIKPQPLPKQTFDMLWFQICYFNMPGMKASLLLSA